MSTTAVSANPPQLTNQQYIQQRQTDLRQLGKDLNAGDVTDALAEFNAIQTLAQEAPPIAGGDAFLRPDRQQDFIAIGQALESGDLSSAQQAYADLTNQAYLQQRHADLEQLGQDLKAGELTDAQVEFNAIQTLAQSAPPIADGNVFLRADRQQDFNAIGLALQSGDLSSAQQAFDQLTGHDNCPQSQSNGVNASA